MTYTKIVEGVIHHYLEGTELLHNLKGPAVLYEHGSVEFHIAGHQLTEMEFLRARVNMLEDTLAFFKGIHQDHHPVTGSALVLDGVGYPMDYKIAETISNVVRQLLSNYI